MAASRPDNSPETAALDYDVIIIGAGLSGMYQLYRLRELGLTPVLLTGDNEAAARHVAAQVGIDEVIAGSKTAKHPFSPK